MVKYKQLYHNEKYKIVNKKKKIIFISLKIRRKKSLSEEYIKIDYNGLVI